MFRVKINSNMLKLPISRYLVKYIFLLVILLPACHLKAQKERNIITFDIGSFTITLLSDGQQQSKSDVLIGVTDEMLMQTMPDRIFPTAVNAFLVETSDQTILFDAGLGMKLSENLKDYGKSTDDIDAIILTHMHGDHIGGLLYNNKKSFPKATLYIPQPEYDYWMNDEAMQSMPEKRKSSFTNTRKIIDVYKDKLKIFNPGTIDDKEELVPAVRSIAAYGHTPGHTGYLIESDDSKIFIGGDLVHAADLQIQYPQVAVSYDSDPVKAVKTREKLLRYLSDNTIPIAGMHIPFPGIGKIRKNSSDKYYFALTCECEGR